MRRFAVNHYICPEDWTVPQFLAAAVDAGAGAVGLTLRALDEVGAPELKVRLDDLGLKVSSLNSAGFFTHDDSARRVTQDGRNAELIEAAALLEANVLCVITGGKGLGVGTLEAARARIADRLGDLATQARAAGVRLGVEPIHPVDVLTKGCVNGIADGLALIGDDPALGLIVDVYHSWWDPMLWRVIAQMPQSVALIQLCNVIEPVVDRKPEREFLSAGEVDIPSLVNRWDDDGYQGWYEFELFAHHLRGRSVPEAIDDAARVLGPMSA